MESIMFYPMAVALVSQQLGAMQRDGYEGSFLLEGVMTAIWAAFIVLLFLWIARHRSTLKNPLRAIM